jgi:hypothetical protein
MILHPIIIYFHIVHVINKRWKTLSPVLDTSMDKFWLLNEQNL